MLIKNRNGIGEELKMLVKIPASTLLLTLLRSKVKSSDFGHSHKVQPLNAKRYSKLK